MEVNNLIQGCTQQEEKIHTHYSVSQTSCQNKYNHENQATDQMDTITKILLKEFGIRKIPPSVFRDQIWELSKS